jgi:hypothetical protein
MRGLIVSKVEVKLGGRIYRCRASCMSKGLDDLPRSMCNHDRYNCYSSISSIRHTDVLGSPSVSQHDQDYVRNRAMTSFRKEVSTF